MKKLLFVSFLIFSVFGFSQESNLLNYSEVVKVDSTRKAEDLYAQSKMWFVDAFKNSKYVIQLDDSANKTIIGEGSLSYSSKYFVGSGATIGNIKFKITISAKDGRYKYDIGDFNHEGKSFSFGYIMNVEDPENRWKPTKSRIKVYKEIKDQIASQVDPLILSLKNYMSENKVSTKQDW